MENQTIPQTHGAAAVTIRALFGETGDPQAQPRAQPGTKLQARLESRIACYKKRHRDHIEEIDRLTLLVKIRTQELEIATQERDDLLLHKDGAGLSIWTRETCKIEGRIKIHEERINRLCEDGKNVEREYRRVKTQAKHVIDSMNLAGHRGQNNADASLAISQLRAQFLDYEDNASDLQQQMAENERQMNLIRRSIGKLKDDKQEMANQSRNADAAATKLKFMDKVQGENQFFERENYELRKENECIGELRNKLYEVQSDNQQLNERIEAESLRSGRMEEDFLELQSLGQEMFTSLVEFLGETQRNLDMGIRLKMDVWRTSLLRLEAANKCQYKRPSTNVETLDMYG